MVFSYPLSHVGLLRRNFDRKSSLVIHIYTWAARAITNFVQTSHSTKRNETNWKLKDMDAMLVGFFFSNLSSWINNIVCWNHVIPWTGSYDTTEAFWNATETSRIFVERKFILIMMKKKEFSEFFFQVNKNVWVHLNVVVAKMQTQTRRIVKNTE